ncbi:hypothetical protein JCGZ_00539 [Jatropha curcas]|uniref:Uncharacterized protein n=1 Tax=Jatropha curcas TaxID=180498 RepID=A0A067LEQ0_JATCU|nr:hypothetical protein JCGZ_00539 [Jatropha curcas]
MAQFACLKNAKWQLTSTKPPKWHTSSIQVVQRALTPSQGHPPYLNQTRQLNNYQPGCDEISGSTKRGVLCHYSALMTVVVQAITEGPSATMCVARHTLVAYATSSVVPGTFV